MIYIQHFVLICFDPALITNEITTKNVLINGRKEIEEAWKVASAICENGSCKSRSVQVI